MATKKPTTKTPTKTPTAKAPTTTTKKTYVDKTSSYNQELINKAQAYMTGTDYVAGKPVDTSFWGSSGGGGKNTLYGNAGKKNYAGKEFTTTDMNAIAKYVYEQDKKAAAAANEEAYNSGKNEGYNAGYNSGYNEGTAGLNEIKQMYSNMQTQQNTALQNAQRLSADQINNAYDLSARDYYQLYKTQQAKLPENLSKAGVTGGASESAQLKLMNNYSENLYKNEAARNNQLAGVNQNYNDQIAQNSINAANQMANAYLQMAQQQLAYKRQDELAAKEQQAQAEENAAARTVAQWNANVRARMEEQLAKGDTIWTWTDESGKIHWTTYESRGLAMGGKKLSPSSSKVKSSGGSSTYSAGSGVSGNDGNGGGGGDVPSRDSYDLIKNVALGNMYGNSTYGMRVGGREDALNYIKRSLSGVNINGQVHKLTESQAVKLLKELGLN